MKQGNRIPVRVNELYASEIKYGYDKKLPRFMYRIDGEIFRRSAVFERTRAAGLRDETVARRLVSHSTHTWDELLRPAVLGQARNDYDKAKANAKRSASKKFSLAKQRVAMERRAFFARKKAGHKEL